MIVNGKTYKILQGYQVKESLTYALDSCVVITYLNNKEEFKRFDIAEFLDKKWFISIVNEEYKGNKIMHSLTLVELTLILEKYILSPVSFTNADDTLLYQVRKLLYKVEPLRAGEEPRFKLSNALESFLMGKRGEDFIYNERMTLREILDDMLSFYGFRSYVEDVNSDLSEITIGYLDLNKKSSTIKELPRMTSYRSNASVDSYANEFDILLTNAQSKKKQPFTEEWQTMKPNNVDDLSDENLKIVTTFPIEEITKFIFRFVADVLYMAPHEDDPNIGVPSGELQVEVWLDLKRLCVEEEIYVTLPNTTSGGQVGREHLIPYARGSRSIGILETQPGFFNFSRLKLTDYINRYQTEIVENYLIEHNLPYLTSGALELQNTPSQNDLKYKGMFQVTYYPMLDFNYKESKEQTDISKKITSILNQTERSVDIEKYSATVRSIANLTGVKDLTIETVVKNQNDLYELGDRVPKGFSLVQTSKQVYNEFIKVEYIFIENYRVNTSSRFSRERRLYNIPIENLVNRSLLLKDKLLLSSENIVNSNNAVLSNETLERVINSFNNNQNNNINDFIDGILFKTESVGGLLFPSTSWYFLKMYGMPLSKSCLWFTRVQDNYSVGLSSGKKIVGGRDTHLNPYADDLGEAEKLTFKLVASNLENLNYETDQTAIGYSLPLVPSTYLAFGTLKPFIAEEFTENVEVVIEKDRLETFENITYQLETKATEDIIVGEQFMKMINLLKDHEKEQLWIWVSQTEQYGLGDNECRGVKTVSAPIIVSGASNYIETDYALLASMTSWAVGTLSGKLVFGVNNNKNPNKNKVYFGLSKN